MKAISLQSGSNGNCLYVEAGGTRLLIDAGITGITAEQRLSAHGVAIRQVNALLISHDHTDHVRCAGVYHRKYGIPLYSTHRTLEAAMRRHPLGRLTDVRHFQAGEAFTIGEVTVRSIPTRHDGVDGSAFTVEHGGKSLGILTDLGHAFEGLGNVVAALDGVFIESNYDPEMLRTGPYPAFLKRRIAGPHGHISNLEAAELLASFGHRLQWACLAHLSENNNQPALALETHRSVLGLTVPLCTASRYGASRPLFV